MLGRHTSHLYVRVHARSWLQDKAEECEGPRDQSWVIISRRIIISRCHKINATTRITTTITQTELLSTLCPAAPASSSVSSASTSISLQNDLSRRQQQRRQQREQQRHERQQHGDEVWEGAQGDCSVTNARDEAGAPLDIASVSESAWQTEVEEEGRLGWQYTASISTVAVHLPLCIQASQHEFLHFPLPLFPNPHPFLSVAVYYEEEEQLILSPEWALYFSMRKHAREARKGKKKKMKEADGWGRGRQAGSVG